MTPDEDIYHALCCYTLERGDAAFTHQHVVDAFTAQHADAQTSPRALTFALVGLYLHVQMGLSGKQVQQAHMVLARKKIAWPAFPLPEDRGRMTVADVMGARPGALRDEAIQRWCASVWEAFGANRQTVAALLRRNGISAA